VPALLIGVEVGGGRTILDPAQAADGAALEQQGLDQRGLAGPAM